MEQRDSALAGSTHALTLNRDGLPLLLLAAVHHPQAEVRTRLLLRIDALIAARHPVVSDGEIRHLLGQYDQLDLDPASLDLAVRVVRLAFARTTVRHEKQRVLLVGPDDPDGHRPVTLACSPLRFVAKGRRPEVRLAFGEALAQVAGFHFRPSPMRVICHVSAGFALEISGTNGWSYRRCAARLLTDATLASGSTLHDLGLAVQDVPGGLRITTPTPEAILRFSACLAREEVIRLRFRPRTRTETTLFIRTHDFDGTEAEFPTVVFPPNLTESWLTGLPPLELTVPMGEVLPVVHWGQPPAAWLPDVIGPLLAPTHETEKSS